MAIIYSYQENNELRLSDMLVGTATTLHDGKVRKVTKNFTLGELKTFINGGDLILTNSGTSGPATLTDNILNIPVYQGAITLTTTGTSGSATLIGNTLNIPNYTTPTPTLQSVTTAGNTTSNNIIISNGAGSLVTFTNGGILFESLSSHGSIFSTSGFSLVDDITTQQFSLDFDGLLLKTITTGAGGRIKADLLTSVARTYQLPDASGTIALASDIPSAITLTTTGSSGPATLVGSTLNVPDYSSGISPGIQHGTASGTDTYTVTITGVAAYADGDAYLIRFTNGNTTSATLNINGLGAIALYRNNDGPLIGGDVLADGEMLCVYNSTSNIFQCIGVAPNTLLAYVTNAETTTITRGQAVYVSGGVGDRVKVKLAYNTADLTSAQTIGIVSTASIAANQKGIIIVQGQLDNLSLFPTSTWADGDYIYLGATPGTITNVKPVAPNHLVYLGYVTTASNGNAGRMYVKVQNGYELQELHNVYINPATLANYDGIFYNSATSLWENKNVSQVLPERRNANNSTNNNINYCGTADKGSAESSAVWTIERLTIGSSGSVTIGTATNVAWTNRESVIYT